MEKATDKQLALLQKLGATFETNVSKEEASKLIEQIITTQQKYKKEVKQPQVETYEQVAQRNWSKPTSDKSFKAHKIDTSSYYVAYAKDLCIAMIEAIQRKDPKTEIEVDKVMQTAIACIDMAREEFK